MIITDLARFALQGFGVLYVVGAVFLLRQLWVNRRLDSMIDQLDRMSAALNPSKPPAAPEDKQRDVWMAAGGALTFAAGLAMAFASKWAFFLLVALAVQQLFYFARQRWMETRATTAEDAHDARPAQSTQNAFVFCLALLTLAGWLWAQGALH